MRRCCDIGGFDHGTGGAAQTLDEHGPEQRRERGGGANLVGVREIDEDGCANRE